MPYVHSAAQGAAGAAAAAYPYVKGAASAAAQAYPYARDLVSNPVGRNLAYTAVGAAGLAMAPGLVPFAPAILPAFAAGQVMQHGLGSTVKSGLDALRGVRDFTMPALGYIANAWEAAKSPETRGTQAADREAHERQIQLRERHAKEYATQEHLAHDAALNLQHQRAIADQRRSESAGLRRQLELQAAEQTGENAADELAHNETAENKRLFAYGKQLGLTAFTRGAQVARSQLETELNTILADIGVLQAQAESGQRNAQLLGMQKRQQQLVELGNEIVEMAETHLDTARPQDFTVRMNEILGRVGPVRQLSTIPVMRAQLALEDARGAADTQLTRTFIDTSNNDVFQSRLREGLHHAEHVAPHLVQRARAVGAAGPAAAGAEREPLSLGVMPPAE